MWPLFFSPHPRSEMERAVPACFLKHIPQRYCGRPIQGTGGGGTDPSFVVAQRYAWSSNRHQRASVLCYVLRTRACAPPYHSILMWGPHNRRSGCSVTGGWMAGLSDSNPRSVTHGK